MAASPPPGQARPPARLCGSSARPSRTAAVVCSCAKRLLDPRCDDGVARRGWIIEPVRQDLHGPHRSARCGSSSRDRRSPARMFMVPPSQCVEPIRPRRRRASMIMRSICTRDPAETKPPESPSQQLTPPSAQASLSNRARWFSNRDSYGKSTFRDGSSSLMKCLNQSTRRSASISVKKTSCFPMMISPNSSNPRRSRQDDPRVAGATAAETPSSSCSAAV